MIIMGFRVIFRTLSTGLFFCPKEGADRNYRLRRAQRFFTIFFIPVIPLKKLGTLVECEGCQSQFDEGVLEKPTFAKRSESLDQMARRGVVSLLRAGTVSSTGREQAVRLVSNYVATYDDAQLTADLADLPAGLIHDELNDAAAVLDDHAKEGLLTRFALVGLADKASLTDAERNVLTEIANGLGLTPAHGRGVIDSTIDQVKAN